MTKNNTPIAQPATTVKEVLIAARWIQNRLGWCQGRRYEYDDGRKVACCMLGAVEFVVTTTSLQDEAVEELRTTVENSVASFNDTVARTKCDVLEAFDDTIARL